jgi:hypothetical protein
MTFAEVADHSDPAYAIDEDAHKIVFDSGDGMTGHLERLSPQARLIYQVCRFESEIHSGGFGEFFTTSIGDHCEELLEHLATLGALNSVRILRSAMACFPDGIVPTDRAERETLWSDSIEDDDAAQETFEALEQEFYAYEDNLRERMNDYVRAHRDAHVGA